MYVLVLQSISPGVVKTDILIASGIVTNLDSFYEKQPSLEPKDIADSVVYVLGAPGHVQVSYTTKLEKYACKYSNTNENS